ncbi:hypothetical protein CVT26_007182 [Gymnopilus dilepis]|uniref:PH domain-containing protein n=1 Tax=Gymnopilus dilepis TaxID=231916 RepID=A0A409W0B2_9AGAR|nr:hypothetical protein CVT26_007182 [Gymnopilus dilepis]
MEIRTSKPIPLACRFLSYDQWLLTHVDPTWKIKHVKQVILAKCFNLPFDPRPLTRETSESGEQRSPSPIIFAPDDSHRPASPIQFATPQEVRKKRSQGVDVGRRARVASEGDSEGSVSAGETAGGSAAGEDEDEEGFEEEEYDEDDEWDEDEDMAPPGKGLVGPAGGAEPRNSVVIGGRVHVPGVTPPFPTSTSSAVNQDPASAATATSAPPAKARRKFNPLAKIRQSSSNTPASTSVPAPEISDDPTATSALVPYQQLQQDKPKEIYTSFHTLVRFSTGQILEDDIPLSWYDLRPYELVELHASVLPLSFKMSIKISRHLLHPAEMLNAIQNKDEEFFDRLKSKMKKKGKASTNDTNEASTLIQPISSSLALVSLPRHDPEAYAQPYWEGWVRALRLVSRSELDSTPSHHSYTKTQASRKSTPAGSSAAGTSKAAAPSAAGSSMSKAGGGDSYPYRLQEYAMGMTNFSGSMGGGLIGAWAGVGDREASVGLFKDAHGRDLVPPSRHATSARTGAGAGSIPRERSEGGRHGQASNTNVTYEWRERYMVIKDGVVNLFKSREVSITTLLLLHLSIILVLVPILAASSLDCIYVLLSLPLSTFFQTWPTYQFALQDRVPTHRLPLTSLAELRDVEDMGPVLKSKMSRSTTSFSSGDTVTASNTARNPTSQSHSHRHRSRGASATPTDRSAKDAQRNRRSTSLPRSSTSTAKDPRTGGAVDGSGTATLPSSQHVPPSSRALTEADDRGHSQDRDHVRSAPSKGVTRPLTEAEREARRLAAEERQRAREERERQRKLKEKHEKEIEYLRQWDEIGISLWSKKDKDKGKGKEKEGGGQRGRASKGVGVTGAERKGEKGQGAFKGKEHDWEVETLREHQYLPNNLRGEDDNDHENDRRRHRHRSRAKRDDRSYIPSTTEEAEAAGMKIVCAKFRQLRPAEREELEKALNEGYRYRDTGVRHPKNVNLISHYPPPKFPSTAPTLAGEPNINVASDPESHDGIPSGSGRLKYAKRVVSGDSSTSAGGPSRRPSLPSLVTSLEASSPHTTLSSNPLLDAVYPGTSGSNRVATGPSNVAASSSAATSPTTTVPKFMGGFFGKDRDSADKERKTREKEQKALEREMQKAMRRKTDGEKDTGDEDESDLSSSSGWGLRRNAVRSSRSVGKMKEGAVTSTLLPPESKAPSTSAPQRPKLTLSPVEDYQGTRSGHHSSDGPQQAPTLPQPLTEIQQEEESDDSDSRSLSSPVFAHSDGDNDLEDDFDEEFGFGVSGYRRDRTGYRYGGYQRRADGAVASDRAPFSPGATALERDIRAQATPSGAADVALRSPTAKAKVAPSELGIGPGSRDLPQARSMPSIRTEQRREARSKMEEERGEWVVLDMGNEYGKGLCHPRFSYTDSSFTAYSSILRILHRHFAKPLDTAFVKLSPLPIADSSTTTTRSNDATPVAYSLSPSQAHHWSSTTLAATSDSKSLRSMTSTSSTHDILPLPSIEHLGGPLTAKSDAVPQHPPVLKDLEGIHTKPQPNSSPLPGLCYPEWRLKVVQRAKRHGMREAGRPLHLALRVRDLESDIGVNLQDGPDGNWNKEATAVASEVKTVRGGNEGQELDVGADGADSHAERAPTCADDDQRELRVISVRRPAASQERSHVSDSDNCDSAPRTLSTTTSDQDAPYSSDLPEGNALNDSPRNEEDAVTLGMTSHIEDSDNESEMEWVAWVTDLPRQVSVEAMKRRTAAVERAMQRKRLEEERMGRLKPQGESDHRQLSPMVFSSPFGQEQELLLEGDETKHVLMKTHSRASSTAESSRISRLYHSHSMPLATVASTQASLHPVDVTVGSSVPSSPPNSAIPSSIPSEPSSIPSKIQLDRPILTPEQMRQIEAETELDMLSKQEQISSSRMSSLKSPSFLHHDLYDPVPTIRQSNSVGASRAPGFLPGFSPPRLIPGSPFDAQFSRASDVGNEGEGSMEPSASTLTSLHSSSNTEGGISGGGSGRKSGRQVLRKRLSDLGKHLSGDGGESPPSSKAKKPQLSLVSLSGPSSPKHTVNIHGQHEVRSPVYEQERELLRSPTSPNRSFPARYRHGSGISGPESGSGGKMLSARALLRHVRSGSSLRMDAPLEDQGAPLASSYPLPKSPIITLHPTHNADTPGPQASPTGPRRAKKKRGAISQLLRDIDSAFESSDDGDGS